MATNHPASMFAGVAIDPIPVGKTGRILTEELLAGTQLRFAPSIHGGVTDVRGRLHCWCVLRSGDPCGRHRELVGLPVLQGGCQLEANPSPG